VSCANPLDIATLGDYWLGAAPQAEQDAIEDHVFACDARLREMVSLADGIRKLARQGSLLIVVSDAFLKRVAAEGLRVREYAPPNGGSIACTVTAEDDFLIGRLAADLRGAKRVDLSLCDRRGNEQVRMADIPFDAEDGDVMFQQPITYAKAAPSETLIARLLALDDAGVEHLLGEYTFNHTRTLPGPGAS